MLYIIPLHTFNHNQFIRKKRFDFAKGNTEQAQSVNSQVVFQIIKKDVHNTLLLKICNEPISV